MPSSTHFVKHEHFYSAVGRASSSWYLIEESLRDVFTRLVICTIAGSMVGAGQHSIWIVGNIFYGSTNLRARLGMITEIVDRVVTDVSILAEWNACKNRTLDLYKRRNVLAHGVIWGNEAGATEISASVFATDRRRLTYQQVCACDESFQRQAKRLEELAISINLHLAKRTGSDF